MVIGTDLIDVLKPQPLGGEPCRERLGARSASSRFSCRSNAAGVRSVPVDAVFSNSASGIDPQIKKDRRDARS